MKNYDRDAIFKSVVAKQCSLKSLKKYDIADKIGMPRSTFYIKLRNPGSFTVDEMRDICAMLQFSVEEKTSII